MALKNNAFRAGGIALLGICCFVTYQNCGTSFQAASTLEGSEAQRMAIDPAPPSGPTALLKWDLPEGTVANEFVIDSSTDGTTFQNIGHASGNDRSFSARHLLAGKHYTFRIRAVNDVAESEMIYKTLDVPN